MYVFVGVCIMKWEYPYVFLTGLGSYETGHHK